MSKNWKSSQNDQDEAFFGSISTNSARKNRTSNSNRINNRRSTGNSNSSSSRTNNNNYSSDQELAMKLQEEYSRTDAIRMKRELARQEKQDMELARRLQNENEAAAAAAAAATGNHSRNHNRDRNHSRNYNHNHNRNDERKRQEDEDAKLALAMQEEESSRSANRGSNRGSDSGSLLQRGSPPTNEYRNNRMSGIRDHHTINALVPKCATCDKVVLRPIHALGNIYHRECFRCMSCHGIIQPNETFAVTKTEDGQSFPLHKECYNNLYGLKCSVCFNIIQGDSSGKVSYIKHPFFEEVICATHSRQRKCAGCSRFEPNGSANQFADLGDAGRCVCYSCCRTVIVDSNDAIPLWNRIMHFFERNLKLPVFTGMSEIPVLIVPHATLNSQSQNSNHQGSTQLLTRGLCLSEHQIGWNLRLPSLRFDNNAGSFLPSDAESRGHTYFRIPDASKANPQTNVTAILCLTGLPADLSASILAHEATHAWIKLHPNFDPQKPIPPMVEEGCCQLVAMLFLNDGLDGPSSENTDDGPSDEKLRQYFKFSIETDTNEVYGEGYRRAAGIYAQIGIEALLSHVVTYCDFPTI